MEQPTQETGATLPAVRQSVDIGKIVSDLDGAWRLAQNMANSTLVPRDFQKQPANILVALQMGAEIGLAPMQALQSIAVINGRPSIWGDGLLALCVSNPVFEGIDETYDEAAKVARCVVNRKGWRNPIVRTFSFEDAQKAGLLIKDTYKQYLRRMLQMRARSWALRDAFPDVLRGLQVAEEMQDIQPAADAAPVVESVSRVASMMPQVAAGAANAAPVIDVKPEPVKPEPAKPEPPAAKEADDVELMAEAGTAAQAPAQEVVFVSEDQRRKLMGAARDAKVTVDQLKEWLHKKHGFTSTKAIPVDKYAVIFAAVANIPAELEAAKRGDAQ